MIEYTDLKQGMLVRIVAMNLERQPVWQYVGWVISRTNDMVELSSEKIREHYTWGAQVHRSHIVKIILLEGGK